MDTAQHPTTPDILYALNNFTHGSWDNDPTDIWADVIEGFPIDWNTTELLDPDNDGAVFCLDDGRVFRLDRETDLWKIS